MSERSTDSNAALARKSALLLGGAALVAVIAFAPDGPSEREAATVDAPPPAAQTRAPADAAAFPVFTEPRPRGSDASLGGPLHRTDESGDESASRNRPTL